MARYLRGVVQQTLFQRPPSEPDVRISPHPALQRLFRECQRQTFPTAFTEDTQHRFGALHFAYLLACVPKSPVLLGPVDGFPALPGRT